MVDTRKTYMGSIPVAMMRMIYNSEIKLTCMDRVIFILFHWGDKRDVTEQLRVFRKGNNFLDFLFNSWDDETL